MDSDVYEQDVPVKDQFLVSDSGLNDDYQEITGASTSFFRPASLSPILHKHSDQSFDGSGYDCNCL